MRVKFRKEKIIHALFVKFPTKFTAVRLTTMMIFVERHEIEVDI